MGTDSGKRVIVIGAGIVGASIAYHLAAKGANVTMVEAGGIASGVTGSSFAWISTAHSELDPIALLRGAAIQEYRRLEAQLPSVKVRWTGSVCYGVGTQGRPAANLIARAHILELEPNLNNPPQQAFHQPDEGALDAVEVTHALIAGAQTHGATILTQTRVLGFTKRNATVNGVKTAAGTLNADMVVLAAGTGIAHLTAMLDKPLPIEGSPSIFIRYRMQPARVNSLISNSAMEVRQGSEGVLLAAEDYLDDAPQNHPKAIALRTAKAIRTELCGVVSIEPELACIGLRPIAADGTPVIGYLPGIGGVYVCTMHPGVALAAVVGRLVSEEIMDASVAHALGACRPDRFFET